jgi:hypothetical protein
MVCAAAAESSSPAQAQEMVVLLSKDFDRIKIVQLAAKVLLSEKDAAHIDARKLLQGSQSEIVSNWRPFLT